jgi:hypothetical protein
MPNLTTEQLQYLKEVLQKLIDLHQEKITAIVSGDRYWIEDIEQAIHRLQRIRTILWTAKASRSLVPPKILDRDDLP